MSLMSTRSSRIRGWGDDYGGLLFLVFLVLGGETGDYWIIDHGALGRFLVVS